MIRKLLLIMAVSMVTTTTARAANCFQSLNDPTATNIVSWSDLRNHTATTSNPDIQEIQTLDSGKSATINYDYYALTFKKHPSRSIEEEFLRLRRSFPFYAKGQEPALEVSDVPVNFFGPYNDPKNPATRDANQKKWESSDPTGALMDFVLKSMPPALVFAASKLQPVMERGDILVACASPRDIVVATVKTKEHGFHPVNGNRGFGIKDNSNGTWTFYTKGADRLSWSCSVLMFENAPAGAAGVPDVPKGERIFSEGHQFWLKFFGVMGADLDRQGMAFHTFTTNSKRYPFPEAAAASKRTSPCEPSGSIFD